MRSRPRASTSPTTSRPPAGPSVWTRSENVSLEANTDLTAADVIANSGTIDNVRLWEPRPALSTYSQIQEIRLYYAFNDVDIDRYIIDDKYRQVLLSARELDQTQLQEQSQTWVNKHLTYTHGYGFVMSPVNEAGGDGLPLLFVSNIPPTTSTDLKITRPEIYYGEMGNEFVVVKTTSPSSTIPRVTTNVFGPPTRAKAGSPSAARPGRWRSPSASTV